MNFSELLQQAEITSYSDCTRVVFSERIDAKDFSAMKEIFKMLGGRYVNVNTGFVFNSPFAETKQALEALSRERDIGKKVNNLNFFPTPKSVSNTMMDMLDNSFILSRERVRILEPSAGTGALIDALLERFEGTRMDIVLLEKDPLRSLMLRKKYHDVPFITVKTTDFLEETPQELGAFDVVLMNPPFEKYHWVTHLNHAKEFLSSEDYSAVISVTPHITIHMNKALNPLMNDMIVGNIDYHVNDRNAFNNPDVPAKQRTMINTDILLIDNLYKPPIALDVANLAIINEGTLMRDIKQSVDAFFLTPSLKGVEKSLESIQDHVLRHYRYVDLSHRIPVPETQEDWTALSWLLLNYVTEDDDALHPLVVDYANKFMKPYDIDVRVSRMSGDLEDIANYYRDNIQSIKSVHNIMTDDFIQVHMSGRGFNYEMAYNDALTRPDEFTFTFHQDGKIHNIEASKGFVP